MGGGSRPADPKPTPFIEPPGPKNPVPNWFGTRAGGGETYQPDFSASKQSFGGALPSMPPPPSLEPAPAPEPMAMPAAPMQPQAYAPAPYSAPPVMPFSIPTQITPAPMVDWGQPSREGMQPAYQPEQPAQMAAPAPAPAPAADDEMAWGNMPRRGLLGMNRGRM